MASTFLRGKTSHNLRACFSQALFISLFLIDGQASENSGTGSNRLFNVRDLGAVADGSVLATGVIQKAIDECSANGGGTVFFPAGHYLSGTIQLKDNVILQLSESAVLLGSTHLSDYKVIDGFKDGLGEQVGAAFIIAVDAGHIGIEGPGKIDGQGKELALEQAKTGDKDWGRRPFLIRILRCHGVAIQNVKITGSGAWTTHLSRCTDVSIRGVQIDSYGLSHNDGIDIDSCQKLEVRDSIIHSGDDSICFKTLGPFPCRDITVDNCTLQSGEGAIKFGTESVGAFESIYVCNCVILSASEGGIKLFSVDGAQMQNISVSNIQMSHVNLPIIIRLGARLHTFHPGDLPQPVGFIKDVRITHIKAKDCSNVGILISGIPRHSIGNLSLQDIQLDLPGGGSKDEATTLLEEKEKDYPEVKMFGKVMPVYGIYARHVAGIKVDHLAITLAKPDMRPASYFEDVSDRCFTNSDGMSLDTCLHK